MSYLNELKARAAARDSDTRITVHSLPGLNPMSMLTKLRAPQGDTNAYDEVWLVVDEDGEDRTGFIAKCRALNKTRQQWHAVISRPCFEAWLTAHYGQVRNYADQTDAQNHFRALIPSSVPHKQLPPDFPYDSMHIACERCRLSGVPAEAMNQLPPSPGSGMPHLIRSLLGDGA